MHIVINSVWSGHGEPKLEARFYDDNNICLGREIVASRQDAIATARDCYHVPEDSIVVEEK